MEALSKVTFWENRKSRGNTHVRFVFLQLLLIPPSIPQQNRKRSSWFNQAFSHVPENVSTTVLSPPKLSLLYYNKLYWKSRKTFVIYRVTKPFSEFHQCLQSCFEFCECYLKLEGNWKGLYYFHFYKTSRSCYWSSYIIYYVFTQSCEMIFNQLQLASQ